MICRLFFKKSSCYGFLLCLIFANLTSESSFRTVIGSLKEDLSQLTYSSKGVCALKLLLEHYRREPYLFFVQDYAQDFCTVFHELSFLSTNGDLHDYQLYNRAVCFLLSANHTLVMRKFEHDIMSTLETIKESINYWNIQKESAVFYFLHKHPAKWIHKNEQQYEIEEHLAVLESTQNKYELLLGQLMRYQKQVKTNHEVSFLYGWILQGIRLLCDAYGCHDTILSDSPTNEYDPKQLFRLVHQVITVQDERLLADDILKQHVMPGHIERNWLRYVAAIGLVGLVVRAKNDPASKLNLFLEQHKFNEYGEHFANFCDQYVVIQFKKLMNALFGYSVEELKRYGYPLVVQDIVDGQKEGRKEMDILKKLNLHIMPEDFDIGGVIKLPYPGLHHYIIPKMSTADAPGLLHTHKVLGNILFKALSAQDKFYSLILNLSNDLHLILKLATATPFCIAAYGFYKGATSLYKKLTYVNKEPLYLALLNIQQFIVEQLLQESNPSKGLSDNAYGKLVFLLHQVKKQANSTLSTVQYKLFLKDMRKIMMDNTQWAAKQKMVEIVIEKYKIASLCG